MATYYYILSLACIVLLAGCWYTPESMDSSESLDDHEPEEEIPLVIKINSFKVTDKTLTMDYQVSNPFEDDIWICETSSISSTEEAGTIIKADTLWITQSTKDENKDLSILVNPIPISKYFRMRPGESHSEIITLDLPIVQFPYAGIYDRTEELAKKRKQINLHRCVFELGYFPPKCNHFFIYASEHSKKQLGIKDNDTSVVDPVMGLRISPYVVDEIHKGKSNRVLYIRYGSPSENLEESSKILITDVNIPCSVYADDPESS